MQQEVFLDFRFVCNDIRISTADCMAVVVVRVGADNARQHAKYMH